MINNKRRYFFLGAIIIVAILIGIKLIPTQKHEQIPKTAKEIAQNECSLKAYTKYIQSGASLWQQNDSSPLSILSVEKIIAKRRLEEQFCLEFVRCLRGDPEIESLSLQSVIDASKFDSCLRDEALEDYDAVPREDNHDTPPND